MDTEDLALLEEDLPSQREEKIEVVIDDPGAHVAGDEPTETVPLNVDIKWSRRCPSARIPDPIAGLGVILIPFCDEDDFPSPLLIFEKACWLDDLLNNIVIPQSQLYKFQKGEPFETSNEEMRAFLGMIFTMSYHVLPRFQLYWCLDPDVNVPIISKVMTRHRFFEIRTSLHFANNADAPDKNDPQHDRAWKLRPIINHFNDAFLAGMAPTTHQTIDERMVKFEGQNVMKQYMKDKPIDRCFKHFCRNCSNTGYVFEFDIYTGKKTQVEVGLAGVVLQLTRQIKERNIRLLYGQFLHVPVSIDDLET